MEEVTQLGSKMNHYRGILAKAVLEFAEGHQDDEADLSRLVDAFRAGWKVYREKEDESTTVNVFMKGMNNQLWVKKEEAGAPPAKKVRRRKKPTDEEGSKISCCTMVQ